MVRSFHSILGARPRLHPRSNFLSHSRKIKCDGAHPVCSTCIRRRSPRCDYDDEPRRRGPDRTPRFRTHHDSGAPPSLTRPRRSQKRSSNDGAATPITPSTTQSPPYTTSATISRIGLSNRSPTPPMGAFDSTRLYPSPSTSTLLHQGLVTKTPTRNPFGGSPSTHPSQTHLHLSGTHPLTPNDSPLLPPVSRSGRFDSSSVLNSFPVRHPGPSASTGTRDQSGNLSYEPPYPDFVHRSVVIDTRPHNPYLPDNGPRSSSEFPYTRPVIPMQVSGEKDDVKRQIVRRPYIFASSSFPMSRGMNMVHSDPSVEVCP
jgi:Fungal Zn(2)-Cys(6) binuclear cluster domain